MHRGCLPISDQPVNNKWFCRVHDENEPADSIMLYDAVWCTQDNILWRPALVTRREESKRGGPEEYANSIGPFYTVLFFIGDCLLSSSSLQPISHVLPFENHHADQNFATEYADDGALYRAITDAAQYHTAIQKARLNMGKTWFTKFRLPWIYETICSNVPMSDVAYVVTSPSSLRFSLQRKPILADGSSHHRLAAEVCIGKVTQFAGMPNADAGKCECHTLSTSRACHPATCFNAACDMECDENNCSMYSYGTCNNRRLERLNAAPGSTKRYNSTLIVHECGVKGKGLFAKVPFLKDAYVVEYVGEVISNAEQRRRELHSFANDHQPTFYYLRIDSVRVLDAQLKGNVARFANHSCDPNCTAQRVQWRGDVHVVLKALRDINTDEEITYNYDWGTAGKNPMACNCGSANCARIIGKQRKRDNQRAYMKAAKKTGTVNDNIVITYGNHQLKRTSS